MRRAIDPVRLLRYFNGSILSAPWDASLQELKQAIGEIRLLAENLTGHEGTYDTP
jgi:hypothetical protein